MFTIESGERWEDAPIDQMIMGPCPRCIRDGKRRNTCQHQLPYALGYVIASFDVNDGQVTEVR